MTSTLPTEPTRLALIYSHIYSSKYQFKLGTLSSFCNRFWGQIFPCNTLRQKSFFGHFNIAVYYIVFWKPFSTQIWDNAKILSYLYAYWRGNGSAEIGRHPQDLWQERENGTENFGRFSLWSFFFFVQSGYL